MNDNWHALSAPEPCCCGKAAQWLVVVDTVSVPLCPVCAEKEHGFRDAEGKVVLLRKEEDRYVLRRIVGDYLCSVLELNVDGLVELGEVVQREIEVNRVAGRLGSVSTRTEREFRKPVVSGE